MTEAGDRFWARLTAVFGLVVLAITLAFGALPAVKAAAPSCKGATMVVAFELARDRGELERVLGSASDPCRPVSVKAMDAQNRLDIAGYIPAYTAFALCAAMYVGRTTARRLTTLALCAAILAAAGDYLETVNLLVTSHRIEAPDPFIGRSLIGAWIKFALLAAHSGCLAAICWTRPRRPILGLALLAPIPVTVAAAVDPIAYGPLLTVGLGTAWTAILAFALRDAVRRG